MSDAQKELGEIMNDVHFSQANIPVYQCVDALPHTDPDELKENLRVHITHPVLWTDMVKNMTKDGVNRFYEVGTDDTLQKIVKRMEPDSETISLLQIPMYAGKIKDYSITNI